MIDPEQERDWERHTSGLFVPLKRGRSTPNSNTNNSTQDDTINESRPDVVSYTISAIPLFVPLVAITILGDPTILRVLLWQSNLVALFIGMLQTFLPLVAGSALFVIVSRFAPKSRYRLATAFAIATASLLLIFTPVNLAVIELGLLAAMFVLLHIRHHGKRESRATFAIAAVIILATATIGAYQWRDKLSSLPGSLTARALYGLPREVALETDGSVWAYYLVESNERYTTVITGNPTAVLNLRTEDVAMRMPCRNYYRGTSRSLFSLLTGERGLGTAWCGDLAECFRAVAQPTSRIQPATIDKCIREATHL